MMGQKYAASFVVMVIMLSVYMPRTAYAYLDPGTGSYLFQTLIAVALGIGFVTRQYWSRLKGIFRSIFKKIEERDANG